MHSNLSIVLPKLLLIPIKGLSWVVALYTTYFKRWYKSSSSYRQLLLRYYVSRINPIISWIINTRRRSSTAEREGHATMYTAAPLIIDYMVDMYQSELRQKHSAGCYPKQYVNVFVALPFWLYATTIESLKVIRVLPLDESIVLHSKVLWMAR